MKKLLTTYIFLFLTTTRIFHPSASTAFYSHTADDILQLMLRQELSLHTSKKDNTLLFPQTKNTLRYIFNIDPDILDSRKPEDAIKPDHVEIAHMVNMNLLSAFTAIHIIRWIDTHRNIQQEEQLQLPHPLPQSIEDDDDIKSNDSTLIECSIHENDTLNAFLADK